MRPFYNQKTNCLHVRALELSTIVRIVKILKKTMCAMRAKALGTCVIQIFLVFSRSQKLNLC